MTSMDDITPFDIDLFSHMYANGNSIEVISNKTDTDEAIVKVIIEDNKDKVEFHKNSKNMGKLSGEEKIKLIVDLFNHGYNINQISKITRHTKDHIENILIDNHIDISKIELDIWKLKDFVNEIHVGDVFVIPAHVDQEFDTIPGDRIRNITIKVLKKYPQFVYTTKGCFKYIDLYFGEKL